MVTWIYDAGNGVKHCNSKAGRLREAQRDIDFLPTGTKKLVHFGVCRGGDEEMCEGVYFTSK